MQLQEKISRLPGPILVLGAGGFIGAQLLRHLRTYRSDVYGVVRSLPAWRLDGISSEAIIKADLRIESNTDALLLKYRPAIIFDCVAYGAYSFEKSESLIYETNFQRVSYLVRKLLHSQTIYIHSGSSSEYGLNAKNSSESQTLAPNSDYAVSKSAVSSLLTFYGKSKNLACCNLRLYSIYGPQEDSSRLMPTLVRMGLAGEFPPFVDKSVIRDFVYIEDCIEAYIDSALGLRPDLYGESFNVGSNNPCTIAQLAETAKQVFSISHEPQFSQFPARNWDISKWYGDSSKIKEKLGWHAKTSLREGLEKTKNWMQSLESLETYRKSSKQYANQKDWSISAIIACYKDEKAIPIMYQRLKKVFEDIGIEFEIIFINDNSPDDSEKVIQDISAQDKRVIGISHSRNFGSQSAFRSGMQIAKMESCVLMDGDLQDPPEVISSFFEKWQQGYDVVYGRRVKREAPLYMQFAYKTFYYFFNKMSYIPIPRDAGDFSLIDRKVVKAMMNFPERDLFLRGIRAYCGYRQIGVDYLRPERLFGVTTNSFFKNISWAKKGIFSFSNTPLNMISFIGVCLFLITLVLMLIQFILRVFFPEVVPRGFTTLMLLIMFFGSINLFSLSLLGEYLAKVFEEVKRRPHFVRRAMIKSGNIIEYSEEVSNNE